MTQRQITRIVGADACCDSCQAAGSLPHARRVALIRRAFRLEWLSVAWMSVEAAVAIAAGISAGSLILQAFGLDSLVELASAGVLLWRLFVELRRGEAFPERTERIAAKIAGGLLYALAAYVIAAAAWEILVRRGEAFSLWGAAIAAISMPIMALLARRKLAVAAALGSRALRADAMESVACGWLSLVVLIGLVANLALRASWIDPVISLAIVWLLIKEAGEAWSGKDCC
jgi:divalent metal cation (Fe/Co/Zn/Cd) transporter